MACGVVGRKLLYYLKEEVWLVKGRRLFSFLWLFLCYVSEGI